MLQPTITDFYRKNAEREDYRANYIKSHMPRVKWFIERFKLDQLCDKRIVEVGCGPGLFFSALPARNEFVGLDGALMSKKEQIETPNTLMLRVDLASPDWGMLFDNAERFDVAICSEVIEHVENPNNMLRQLKRILKPDGTLIITIPHESVTHPTSLPGLFFPPSAFKEFLEQWAFLVEEEVTYEQGWWAVGFKCRNAAIQESKPRYFKPESKFVNAEPTEWPNL